MFDEELKPEERSVRGLLVIGLTEPDMEVLDDFEGEGEVSLPPQSNRFCVYAAGTRKRIIQGRWSQFIRWVPPSPSPATNHPRAPRPYPLARKRGHWAHRCNAMHTSGAAR